jgi:hypothetical protein
MKNAYNGLLTLCTLLDSQPAEGVAVMRRTFLVSIGMLLAGLTSGSQAQVVQLPTFRFFGISTTVSVPDSGGAYLGGISRSSRGGAERRLPGLSRAPVVGRPFGNRGIAAATQTGGMSVHASIHDFEAMDKALIGKAGGGYLATDSIRSSRSASETSVAAIRQQHSARQIASAAEARREYERGRQLLAAGKTGVAKVYLQRAAKRADPQLRAEIESTMHVYLRVPRALALFSNALAEPVTPEKLAVTAN